MEKLKYNIFKLANGLRCVHYRAQGNVSYCGVVVNAGSRDEGADKQGLAHFVEHTLFKGTKHRSSWHISNRMERVGGELNAYTTKEETVIYTIAPQGYTARAIELLADLVRYSSFPAKELEKERTVVVDEINSYLDSPGDAVFDKFEDLIYAGSSMGHNILGTPKSVQNLFSADCRSFIDDFYTPDNMTIYCVDSSPSTKIESLILKYWGDYSVQGKKLCREQPANVQSFDVRENLGGHQAHTLTGTRMFGKYDNRRFALFLLNNYLGGPCMNSRLNQQLREKRGYVYTVDSTVALMSNCGVFQIYFGCDEENIQACRKLIDREIKELANSAMKSAKFEQARRQYLGQLKVNSDNRESQALNLGKSLMYYGEIHDIEWTSEQLMAVTPEDVRMIAEMIATSPISTLTLL